MNILGHTFRAMTVDDYFGLDGVEDGTLICETAESILLYDPAAKTITEINMELEEKTYKLVA